MGHPSTPTPKTDGDGGFGAGGDVIYVVVMLNLGRKSYALKSSI
jgi:hypothetical protein